MTAGRIKYNFGEIELLAAALTKQARDMEDKFEQLKRDISPLVQNWTGDTFTKYMDAQQRWDSSAASLADVLRTLAGAVGRGNQDMAETEAANSRVWAG